VQPNVSTHTPGIFGQSDITKLLVKYDTAQTYYYESTLINDNNFLGDTQYLADDQPKDNPVYILYIDYVEIFPTPTVTIANGLKMTGTKYPYQLTLDTAAGCGGSAADDLLPDQYQDLLCWAVRPHMFRYRKQRPDVRQAEQDLVQKELDMCYQIARTNTEPVV